MNPLARHHSLTRGSLCAGLAVALSAVAVPSASATTTVSRSGNTITLTGDAAPDRILGAGVLSTSVSFSTNDAATRLVAGPGCRLSSSRRVLTCGAVARPANPLTLRANLGGGNDLLNLGWATDRHPRAIVDGGDGNDEIEGTMLADDLKGGPGDDLLYGLQDRDGLKGGSGQDVLVGGGDSDALFGEQGRDNLYGDGITDAPSRDGSYSGMDVIDSTDYPTDLTGVTAEQIAAITPEADQVTCGPGALDAATVDAADTVAPTCEGVTGGGRIPIVTSTAPVFPATLAVTLRDRYSMSASLHGEPIRFVVGSSAGGFVSAKLELSPRDARRFHVSGGRIIGVLTTAAVTPQFATEVFIRLNWKARPALGRQHRIRAKLTVSASHNDAANSRIETTTTTTNVTLN